MGKAVKKRASSEDPILDYLPSFDARGQLFASMVSIGWRLALTVLIPVFAGVWADDKFGTKPSLTLTAFFIAIAASGVVIARSYKEINQEMAKTIKPTKKKKIVKNYDEEDTDDY